MAGELWGSRRFNGKTLCVACCALVLVLGACSRGGGPAPVTYGSSSSNYTAGPAAAASTRLASDGTHLVQRGDTLYGISRSYGVPLRGLIDANGLQPPYNIIVGQRLVVPRPRVHQVVRGDTLYGVSRRYGVSLTELSRANGLAPPYGIQVGQALVIPSPGSSSTPPPVSSPSPRAAPAPVAVAKSTAPRSDDAPRTILLPQEKPAFIAARSSGGTQTASKPASSKPAPLPQPPVNTGRFTWPLQGRVLSAYGAKDGGYFNDGINIAAPAGSRVRAAENGVVAYAGSELKGFGQLLLVKHDDGWVTAYAHNARLLVSRGETVTKGQDIALVGATGNVDSPQLHFELRRGSDPVDPTKHLPPLQANLLR